MVVTRRKAVGLAGGVLAAAGLGRPARAQTKTVVGALRLTSHAGSFIALERGWFGEAGLDVELRFFEAAQPMAVAIASGDVDYGVTAMTGGLVSLAQKGAVRVIGGALVEEPGIDGQKILASNAAFEAGLTTPAALDGRSFAITQAGSSFHYMGSRIAGSEGATPQFTPLQKVGAIIGALKSGQVDAWAIVPHIAKSLDGAGAVQIIGDVADYLPDYQVTTVFTSLRNAEEERARTQGFLAALTRGFAEFNATLVDNSEGEAARDALVALIHNHVYTDRPLEKAAPSIIAGAMRLSPQAALNRASLEDQLAWFKEEDLIDPDIAYETVVESSYVPTL